MSKLKIGGLIIAVVLLIVWGCAGLIKHRAEVPQIGEAQYAGTQSCTAPKCHPKRKQDMADSGHRKLFEQGKSACELCHGKGSLHIASTRDPVLILSYKHMSPQEQSEVCLTCHTSGTLDGWYNSTHYQKGISCNECHLSHVASNKQMLKGPDPQICYKCHPQVEQEFKLASTHQFKGQEFRCSHCHKSHEKNDTLGEHNLRVIACLECHKEYGVEFKYPHEPVREDCLECHTSHGSEYPKLCNTDIRNLCESCHSFVAHRTFFIARVFADAEKKLKSGQCTACHKMPHGSRYRSLLKHQGPTRGMPTGIIPSMPGTGKVDQRRIETQPQQESW